MRTPVFAVCLLASASLLAARQPELRTATTSVLFDVVVRDGKGRPVEGLTVADFELQENGRRQSLAAVFSRSAATPPAASAAASVPSSVEDPPAGGASGGAAPSVAESPSAIAFVFDQLSPESRVLAGRVAEAMLARLPPDEWIGVYALDHSLVTAHAFSRDREAAAAALGRVSQRPITVRDASGTSSARDGMSLDPSTSPTVGAESAGGAPDFASRERRKGTGAERLLYEMEMRMAETYERYTRDVQGRMASVGLRAVATAMAPLRGRKALVLFSEGIPLSDQARTLFDTMVATANRAGVTFYPVDAAGLRVHSAVAATAREQDYAGRVALGDEQRSQGAWTRDLETEADLVRSDGTSSLSRLAKETGGLLLENTNGIERIVRRIAEDQRSHYLLAYTPTDGDMDGTYRRVTVKVRQKGLQAVHRSGYWAVAVQP